MQKPRYGAGCGSRGRGGWPKQDRFIPSASSSWPALATSGLVRNCRSMTERCRAVTGGSMRRWLQGAKMDIVEPRRSVAAAALSLALAAERADARRCCCLCRSKCAKPYALLQLLSLPPLPLPRRTGTRTSSGPPIGLPSAIFHNAGTGPWQPHATPPEIYGEFSVGNSA